ncbi:hypothetical protein A3K34_04580 [candidate division WWE3 bacterium RIFOXYC1_FULL_40_10]|uniref:Uncharacterized protein n=1 Tax=candidate division WWE3 bacterium RIFOXYA2_FULL_46_9 TaxID=1802636 RepID=A0A1F4W154_UNCKA|nr:MAG: hypothetical protein A3K58_04580 [candidate division WWE3 bacterium RIFOXYB1_FULL_40_22]OGC62118.1 MAG: hypothetical protein A3K37_04580 [candidate division WWE3 bacterium RIFOXYA1_FULL_40_11]OGC63131.1 MAG: hypothetical protein A2264_00325 [candidate division WWE3 bacterium RIFOXYA2_FULL_46_9]OGC64939.1 MAG: hypothetical protein A2326_02785 [candidate division WWE3 bacterium RIFOXYB2_FULL_41_6]OGC66501.1 MAG: hypothetical protein A3K34_04580 [candidate division WWE3 bacterium RIFOXYC1_
MKSKIKLSAILILSALIGATIPMFTLWGDFGNATNLNIFAGGFVSLLFSVLLYWGYSRTWVTRPSFDTLMNTPAGNWVVGANVIFYMIGTIICFVAILLA